jgi:hypothetical protein
MTYSFSSIATACRLCHRPLNVFVTSYLQQTSDLDRVQQGPLPVRN